METFAPLKDLVNNPSFQKQRQQCLNKFDIKVIDEPIVDVISNFLKLDFCFTLQSCCGHFVHDFQKNPNNFVPLPHSDQITKVEYRIAYIALVIKNSERGLSLFKAMQEIPSIDKDYIQFCCSEWFWRRQVNSYALQVEPERYKDKDSIFVDYKEALHLERTRDLFFTGIRKLLQIQLKI